ncbi:MAG: gliding motility-associated C-terminal domain-containing protein, partial [Crocinitomicaceae bacterium]|nr:gliding motility-associated C-terminal domain-containing protein [Crocinitomicaceae bacterium]
DTDLTATYTPTPAEVTSGTLFLTLTSTNNGGCLAGNDNVQISFVAPPYANFNFTEECLYDAVVFSDFSLPGYGNIDSWTWDFGDLSNSTSQNKTHNYAVPGTYDVELIVTSDVGCSDTTVLQVNVYEVPVANFSHNSGCPNGQVIIDFTDQSTTTNDAINFWSYDFGGQGVSATANPTQLFSSNGNYTILHIVGTDNGCYDTTSQVLNVPPYPVADFSYNTNNGLNIGAVFNFINTSTDAVNYNWNFGNNNWSTDENPSNTYFTNGNYTVTQYVTSALGCVDSTSQLIVINTVTNEIVTLIPNAISPNGDNKNDVWKLGFIDLLYPNAMVEVYNDWGQQIFSSTGYSVPWDGTYNGELVADGTYYYVINLNDTGDFDTEIFKGTVLVLKNKDQ